MSTEYRFESGDELALRFHDGHLYLVGFDGSPSVAWLRLTPKEAVIVADGIKKAVEDADVDQEGG